MARIEGWGTDAPITPQNIHIRANHVRINDLDLTNAQTLLRDLNIQGALKTNYVGWDLPIDPQPNTLYLLRVEHGVEVLMLLNGQLVVIGNTFEFDSSILDEFGHRLVDLENQVMSDSSILEQVQSGLNELSQYVQDHIHTLMVTIGEHTTSIQELEGSTLGLQESFNALASVIRYDASSSTLYIGTN